MTDASLLRRDLDEIIERAAEDLRAFRNTRIFITGGTGFIGTWLLETLHHANAVLATNIRATVLTRSAKTFLAKHPHLADAGWLEFVLGDVRTSSASQLSLDCARLRHAPLGMTSGATFDAVIHAATPASAKINTEQPDEMFDTIVEGTRTLLEFAAQFGSIPFLFTSSGAVYNPGESAYARGKIEAERLCSQYTDTHGLQCKIARLFAFVGPFLPLDQHFAIGNFLGDAVRGEPIIVKGDGTTIRSYMYPTDMITWLLAVFARGEPSHPYNVGSPREIDMRTLASLIANLHTPKLSVTIKQPPQGTLDRYAPDTQETIKALNVFETIPLEEALTRTYTYILSSRA